jgi:2-dehydro-3-deoxyphosphogluconate aldolase / (4S)-4-hydroxy-2-oxoglutarate aldolase
MKFLDQLPLVGIIRGADTRAVEGAVAAAMAGGIRTLEITLNRPEAYDQIELIAAQYGDDLELGAGTVLDPDSARRAAAAGAEFIVTPALVPEVIAYCLDNELAVFPGAMTPTEILTAHCAGAAMVKIFPAASLGPAYLKSLRGPFPFIKLMPTGGVTVESVASWFQAGASAIGVGGELFKKEWLASADWPSIESAARAYVEAVKAERETN